MEWATIGKARARGERQLPTPCGSRCFGRQPLLHQFHFFWGQNETVYRPLTDILLLRAFQQATGYLEGFPEMTA